MTRALAAALLACGCGNASAVESPLPHFSHKAHVLDSEIGCGVCHPNARHAPVAGLASEQTCMGCHKFVKKESPDVIALAKSVEEGKPIEWPRIHRLPDHVYFTHERHLAAGVDCASCHGAMKERVLAVVNQPLTMGFCMDCHRERNAPTDCLACHK